MDPFRKVPDALLLKALEEVNLGGRIRNKTDKGLDTQVITHYYKINNQRSIRGVKDLSFFEASVDEFVINDSTQIRRGAFSTVCRACLVQLA